MTRGDGRNGCNGKKCVLKEQIYYIKSGIYERLIQTGLNKGLINAKKIVLYVDQKRRN